MIPIGHAAADQRAMTRTTLVPLDAMGGPPMEDKLAQALPAVLHYLTQKTMSDQDLPTLIVTGASSSVALYATQSMVAHGWHVAMASGDLDRPAALAKYCGSRHSSPHCCPWIWAYWRGYAASSPIFPPRACRSMVWSAMRRSICPAWNSSNARLKALNSASRPWPRPWAVGAE
jgi:hypothetical protein